MICFVVYPRKSQFNHAFEWMRNVGKEFDVELILRFDDELFLESDLPECVFMRGYNFELSLWFESQAVRVINCTASMALALDKWQSYCTFSKMGLATPLTYLGDNTIDYDRAVSLLGSSQFIVKGVFGEKGEMVWLASGADDYNKAVKKCDGTFLIQEYIQESSGRDIRVWVVGDRAVCAVVRENKNFFKSNISAGGYAKKFDLTDEVRALAVSATKAVGLEISGVDILMGGERGYMLCEINGNAGFRSAVATNQSDVVSCIMRYISLIE